MSRLNIFAAIQGKIDYYKSLDAKDKTTYWKETLINNALYILLIIAIIYTYSQNHKFLSGNSIVNIVSLSAANIPIACGIAGCIVLTGTDLFCRTRCRFDCLYFRIPAAVLKLCNKNVP